MAKTADLNKAYAWFDSLDFDAVRTGDFVELDPFHASPHRMPFPIAQFRKLGHGVQERQFYSPNASPDPESAFGNRYGFVVDPNSHSKTVLTLDLQHIRHGSPLRGFKSISPLEFTKFAAKALKENGNSLQKDPITSYVMARACDARKLPDLERSFLKFLSKKATTDKDLQEPIAKGQMSEADLSFHDPMANWDTYLKEYRRIVWLFPHSSVASRAQDSVDLLKKMIDEHKTGGRKLSKVDDLIAQLPDTFGKAFNEREFYQPFATNEKAAPQELILLSFDAVPELIAAISDRRFTHITDSGSGPVYVLRVGDVALQILDQIAGKPLEGEPLTAPMVAGEIPADKAKALAWWKAARKAGELPPLLIRITKGHSDGQTALAILQARFPDQASTLIGQAMDHAASSDADHMMVMALADSKDPKAADILNEKARHNDPEAIAFLKRRERIESMRRLGGTDRRR